MARICQTIANCLVRQKDDSSFEIKDFLFNFDAPLPPVQTVDEMKSIAALITAAMGGTIGVTP